MQRRRSCVVILVLLAAGCSNSTRTEAPASGPASDPCGLLTDDEVRTVFPGSGHGALDRRLESSGIVSCVWDGPDGRFIAQWFTGDVAAVESEIRSRASGSVDPTRRGAQDNVRYETLAGVGDLAMAVVERADDQKGILSDMGILVVSRGARQAVLMSTALGGRDRVQALNALEALGKAAASRL